MTTASPYTYAQIAEAIEHLAANFQQQPSLTDLADRANLSEYHFQRLFTEWAGVSPKKFGQYLTLDYAKKQLRAGQSLLHTAQDAGLSGTGRLHDLFVTIEGVTPGQYKQAGAGMTLTYGQFVSRFGPYVLGAIDGKVAVLQFLSETDLPEAIVQQTWPNATLVHDPAALQPLADAAFANSLNSYKTGSLPTMSVMMRGSAFQLKVWEALLNIPEGALVSYDQIAQAIGQPSASRAVGTAIGQNPIGYLIPCHRVIKKTGLFGGYRWGVARKQAMLGWEAAQCFG
ncbi:methylated-DNA--[protein]-cysteine S-methyltransferase [Fibrella sp. HMF5335]|uniref:methylated-DNA--[protein]-cysteine S-methyltransferase n=1 Tax=Fibrella rubiginis TaxID=2817060 RepID=A0A939GC86_9BACT|nr:methylated-DNA--[protein]-cysteine S-methyltransferase [Fibrella rubiginis]MBO0935686.1 methylated-DNA--[protein]-cysteine S-methyltransferase [Fibrella rubiginis]